ncbi:hypothetical protein M8818_007182 [Zalaria obscura]|uniref:Uncharacterized protein n=1 Tax=Zalaria obscura TaxID=2024903 RepID=A0ACC3S5B3_9PEZI
MMSSLRSAFYFTIPSLADATPLDCRIYTSNTPGQWNKGAIIAHPYAPLGGSYDDPVVMSLVSLLAQEMVVVTFNFRGAGTSKGKTSWTGKAEREDYTAVIGLLTHYLRHLEVEESGHGQLDLLLAGYSYGSLILSQLLPIATILQTFVSPPTGTPQSEILLRARTLADQTSVLQDIPTDRGRTLSPVKAGRSHRKSNSHSGPIIMGGEESPELWDGLLQDEWSLPTLEGAAIQLPRYHAPTDAYNGITRTLHVPKPSGPILQSSVSSRSANSYMALREIHYHPPLCGRVGPRAFPTRIKHLHVDTTPPQPVGLSCSPGQLGQLLPRCPCATRSGRHLAKRACRRLHSTSQRPQ